MVQRTGRLLSKARRQRREKVTLLEQNHAQLREGGEEARVASSGLQVAWLEAYVTAEAQGFLEENITWLSSHSTSRLPAGTLWASLRCTSSSGQLPGYSLLRVSSRHRLTCENTE